MTKRIGYLEGDCIMTTPKAFSRILAAAACAFVMLGTAELARAGDDGSASRIKNAISTGSTTAIIAELERSEVLVCGACLEPVRQLLSDGRYDVREAAAWWFARRPGHQKQIAAEAAVTLQGSDSTAARNAADMLGTFRHPNAVPVLAAAAQRTELSSEARTHIVFALGTIAHKSANPALEQAMTDTSADVRLAAVTAWSSILRQQGAAPAAALLGDSSVMVRRKASAVAGQFREAAARIGLETRVVTDEDPVVRRNAAWALGRIGDPASATALEQAATDPSSLVRKTAKAALHQLR